MAHKYGEHSNSLLNCQTDAFIVVVCMLCVRSDVHVNSLSSMAFCANVEGNTLSVLTNFEKRKKNPNYLNWTQTNKQTNANHQYNNHQLQYNKFINAFSIHIRFLYLQIKWNEMEWNGFYLQDKLFRWFEILLPRFVVCNACRENFYARILQDARLSWLTRSHQWLLDAIKNTFVHRFSHWTLYELEISKSTNPQTQSFYHDSYGKE